MIEIITDKLPYKLRDQFIIEYNNRLNEIKRLTTGKYDYYTPLNQQIDIVKSLLALSIFYKRILSNFEAADKFTSRVISKSNAKSVQLGSYELTSKELYKLNGLIIQFKEILQKYSIPLELFDYLETKEFLSKIIKLYKIIIEINNNNGKSI